MNNVSLFGDSTINPGSTANFNFSGTFQMTGSSKVYNGQVNEQEQTKDKHAEKLGNNEEKVQQKH